MIGAGWDREYWMFFSRARTQTRISCFRRCCSGGASITFCPLSFRRAGDLWTAQVMFWAGPFHIRSFGPTSVISVKTEFYPVVFFLSLALGCQPIRQPPSQTWRTPFPAHCIAALHPFVDDVFEKLAHAYACQPRPLPVPGELRMQAVS